MLPRDPGNEPSPAAELLGRWQAHHTDAPPPAPTPGPDHEAGSPDVVDDAVEADQTDEADQADEEPEEPGPAARPPASQPAPRVARHAAPRPTPGQRHQPSPRGADQTEAGREVVEALGLHPAPEPAAPPATPPATPPRRARPPAPDVRQSTDVEFAPRVLVRRVLGLLVLVLLPATVAAGYLAYDEPRTLTVGIAGILVVLTLVLYAVRVSSVPTRLAIRSGQLEVVRGSSREVFDLTSRFTRLEVVGRPGRRGWKVLMARFGRDPLVIDSSMVDPAAFMAALERHRPSAP